MGSEMCIRDSRRNYDEGVAYHDYFSTDDLMFNTPYQDSRLANKQEVLALRFKGQPGSIAIDTDLSLIHI